ncbi:MAG: DUF2520 domain-containing protein [Flavobacteriales bacterium]
MSWKIAIVGTGNLGHFWTNYLREFPSVSLRALGSTPEKTKVFCDAFDLSPYDPMASWSPDLALLCLKDDQIAPFLSEHAPKIPMFLHGGSLSLRDFSNPNVGIIYPLQSIHCDTPSDIETIPLLCEFTPTIETIARQFLRDFKLTFHEVSEAQRHTAHVSAVFINNFGYFLMKEGLELAEKQQLEATIFKPLIEKTISNILKNIDLQTGPAKRGDHEIIQKHLALLPEPQKKIYEVLSNSIQLKYKK